MICMFSAYGQPGFRKTVQLGTVVNSIIENIDITRIGDHYYSYGYGAVPDSGLYTLYLIKSDEHGNIIDHKYIFEEKRWLSYWPYVVNRPKIAVIDSSKFVVVLANIDNLDHEVFCIDTGLNKIWHTSIPKYSNNSGERPKRIISDGKHIYMGILPVNKSGKSINTRLLKLSMDGALMDSKINTIVEGMWGLMFNKDKTALFLTGIQLPNDNVFRSHKVKLDLDLNVQSDKYIDTDGLFDFGHVLTLMNDSDDYITTSYDVLPTPPESPEGVGSGYALSITRRDTNLNVIWKIPLYSSTSHNNGFSSIIPSMDGHYYAFGQVVTFMDNKGQYPSDTQAPVLNSFITKFTEGGQIIWQRLDTFDFYDPWNYSWTEAGGIVAMEDGGVMVCGSSQQFGPEDRHGWMMRIDANGCVIEGDCALSGIVYPDPLNNEIFAYPNPTNGLVYIDMRGNANISEDIHYVIYDSIGNLFENTSSVIYDGKISINLSGRMPGIYFIKIIQQGREVAACKIVLSK